MKLTLKLALATLALSVATSYVISSPAVAQGRSGEHGAGDASSGSEASSAGGENRNIASLAAAGNAAHASPTALEHANSESMVGKLKIYSDLQQQLDSGELQQAVVDAQAAFDLAYPNFATMTEEEQQAAWASPEGQALLAAQSELEETTTARDQALAAITDNWQDPEVKAYIDALLTD